MKKEEMQHLIDTIIDQQTTINKLREKISYLHVMIDSLSRELENARRK